MKNKDDRESKLKRIQRLSHQTSAPPPLSYIEPELGDNELDQKREKQGEVVRYTNNLIHLLPFGVHLSTDGIHPLMLFREEKGERVLPVRLNPLEAGVSLSQNSRNSVPVTPHKLTQLILEKLNLQIEKAIFVEIQGAHQYLKIFFNKHAQDIHSLNYLKLRAEEAMSLCLYLNVPFFASSQYIHHSRVLWAETEEHFKGLLLHPEIMTRSHPYVM